MVKEGEGWKDEQASEEREVVKGLVVPSPINKIEPAAGKTLYTMASLACSSSVGGSCGRRRLVDSRSRAPANIASS